MSPVHYHLCRLILLLDRIPRYGRVYQYRPGNPDGTPGKLWLYQKRGMWGFYLLDTLDWLDLLEQETRYRKAYAMAKPRPDKK